MLHSPQKEIERLRKMLKNLRNLLKTHDTLVHIDSFVLEDLNSFVEKDRLPYKGQLIINLEYDGDALRLGEELTKGVYDGC